MSAFVPALSLLPHNSGAGAELNLFTLSNADHLDKQSDVQVTRRATSSMAWRSLYTYRRPGEALSWWT